MDSLKIKEIKEFKENSPPFFGRLIHSVYKHIADIASDFMKDNGFPELRASEIGVFVNIGLDGSSINEIVERLNITKQAVSQNVKKLKKEGFISSEVHPDDSRSVLITFTDKGLDSLLAWKKLTVHMEDMLIAKITKPKLEELRALLQRVIESKDEE
jgi:DNA-binding MarR family transcriptional regulator